MPSYVYILTNKKEGVLYTGVTSDLIKRTFEHKEKITKGFAEKYKADKLVYYEIFDNIIDAITREKTIKNWHRHWKINLVTHFNPLWIDLYEDICK